MTSSGHLERVFADLLLGAAGYVGTVAGSNEEKAHQVGVQGPGAGRAGRVVGPEVFGII